MKQFIAFVRKEFFHIFRDRRTMLILLGMPVVQIILFGFAITTEVKNVRVAILDPSNDVVTRRIIDRLDASEYFSVTTNLNTPDEVEKSFIRGDIDLAVIFSEQFANHVYTGDACVQLVADATDPNTATTQTGYAANIISSAGREMLPAGMQENLLLSDDQIERKIVDDTDEDGTKKAIEECVSDGCNIIFTTSWGYMQVTADMAEKYPDVYFSHGTGYMSNGKNFNNYFGRIYQARYLSGIVAGMNTKNNKIGYVAAQDSSNAEVTGGIDAFAIGVESVNPKAKIYVDVTNSWYDEKKEKKASERLLSMGCDVMTQHCDTSYPQTLAQEKGVYGIGYNSDMSKETPKSCLTSVIWNWSAYYTAAVKSVIDGTWDGSNYYGGMAEGLVEITDLASFAADGTQQKVDEATAEILSGQNNVFDGVLETNTGKKIGQKGKTLDDATITGKINWYYRNVVVIK